MNAFVGFYWTYPVRWAAFIDLSNDADRATAESRTVAYQQVLVRRHVEEAKGILVDEVVALEASPDRGTTAILDYVARASRICHKSSATLLYVNFIERLGWRRHPILAQAVADLQATGLRSLGLSPDEIMLHGHVFDPAVHFSNWRSAEALERERRRYVVPQALALALAEVPAGRGRWAKVAELLNEREVPTFGGGTNWTGENVRKAAGTLRKDEGGTLKTDA